MIGNDVVDLALAKKESNWKRKGFLAKLFTAFEQELINNSINKEEMVWILWSIKESTYKAYQRLLYNRGFYPTKIEVKCLEQIGKQYFSSIQLFGIYFYGETLVENHVINTIVVKKNTDFERISTINRSSIGKKNNGLPYCIISKQPVSISHHGNYESIIRLNKKDVV